MFGAGLMFCHSGRELLKQKLGEVRVSNTMSDESTGNETQTHLQWYVLRSKPNKELILWRALVARGVECF
jgi:hypothetical protein